MFFRKRHTQGPYDFTAGTPLTNGAQEFGFVQPWPTPAEPVVGAGFEYISLRVLSGPQVYHYHASPVAGLGGLQAGQIFTQPLTDNNFSPLD
jgi:hypothetical protein